MKPLEVVGGGGASLEVLPAVVEAAGVAGAQAEFREEREERNLTVREMAEFLRQTVPTPQIEFERSRTTGLCVRSRGRAGEEAGGSWRAGESRAGVLPPGGVVCSPFVSV